MQKRLNIEHIRFNNFILQLNKKFILVLAACIFLGGITQAIGISNTSEKTFAIQNKNNSLQNYPLIPS